MRKVIQLGDCDAGHAAPANDNVGLLKKIRVRVPSFRLSGKCIIDVETECKSDAHKITAL